MRRILFAAMLVASAAVAGCISNTKYGTEVTEIVGRGAGESEVIAKHGAPDGIVYLGTAWHNQGTGEHGTVDKYLYQYRIGGGSTILGSMYYGDKFSNICYLVAGGKVMGGGFVAEGSGTAILGFDMGTHVLPVVGEVDLNFGGFLHPKVRAGYGGDGDQRGPAAGGHH